MRDLAVRLGFSEQECEAIFCSTERTLARRAEEAYHGEVGAFPICRLTPVQRLETALALLPSLRERYFARGISEGDFFATVSDIRLRSGLYADRWGRAGLSRSDATWLRHHFGMKLFRLGSLQFQMLPMIYLDEEGCGEAYMTYDPAWKQALPTGAPVLNVHISHGADLSPAAVDDAFARALPFFSRHFPDYCPQAFMCCSWLLYPKMTMLLPPESNILRFAGRWQLLASAADPSDAISRIYGGRKRHLAQYPQETRLQRNALHHFSLLGVGHGIIEATQ